MAPKKKKAASDPAKLADKESLRRAETEIVSLQRQLELRSHEVLEARRAEREWRDKCNAYSEALVKQREDTLDITADMMRKYKLLQDHSGSILNELEDKTQSIKQDLQVQVDRATKAEDDYARLKGQRDKEVKQLQDTIDGMRLEFADMLKLTIDKMHDKLELSYAEGNASANW